MAETIYYGKSGERGIDEAAYSKDFGVPLQSLIDSLDFGGNETVDEWRNGRMR